MKNAIAILVAAWAVILFPQMANWVALALGAYAGYQAFSLVHPAEEMESLADFYTNWKLRLQVQLVKMLAIRTNSYLSDAEKADSLADYEKSILEVFEFSVNDFFSPRLTDLRAKMVLDIETPGLVRIAGISGSGRVKVEIGEEFLKNQKND